MAVIDEANLEEYTLSAPDAGTIKTILRGLIWQYYNDHKDDVILRKWFFTFRLSDVRFVFVALAGDQAA